VIEEENQARVDLAEQIIKKEVQTGGSGGYHSVTIPLASSAKAALDRLKSGDVNWVVLAIENNESIVSQEAKRVDSARVTAEVNITEPRFYLYTPPGKSTVFIYSCPSKSAPKMRIVYSTSKPNAVNQVSQYGINLASKKIEITDSEDLVDELNDAQTVKPSSFKGVGMTGRMIQPAPGSTPALGGTVKASNLPTVGNQHSIYGLMARPGTEGATTKKKIVIPPRAAWNG